jgi:hypothetical protein
MDLWGKQFGALKPYSDNRSDETSDRDQPTEDLSHHTPPEGMG